MRVVENTGRQVDYTYDALFRLTGEQVTPPGGGPATSTGYTYDAFGNRLTRTDGSGTIDYTYDANDRLTSAGTTVFSYDPNGNLVSRTTGGNTARYGFDALNRLKQLTSPTGIVTTYGYDALGNRVSKGGGPTTTNYLVDPFGYKGSRLRIEGPGCCELSSNAAQLSRGMASQSLPLGLPQVLQETDGAGVLSATTLLVVICWSAEIVWETPRSICPMVKCPFAP